MPVIARGRPVYLFVLPWSPAHVGGVSQVVRALSREMIGAGRYEPLVLVNDWSSQHPVWGELNGVRTVRWRIRSLDDGARVKARLGFWLWERTFQRAFARFCGEQRVAVLNVHYPTAATFPLVRAATMGRLGITPILSFHGADLTTIAASPTQMLVRWRRLTGTGAAVVTCSNALADRVRAVLGADSRPTVAHNGVDAEAFLASAGAGRRGSGRVILNVAKFEAKKGQDVLIDAFAEICHDYEDLTLQLIGANDVELPALRTRCERLGVAGRVSFAVDVPHEQLAPFFRDATLFALPSRQEPFGIVLLEAGAFALPVVASGVGGIPEILTDRVTGRLVAADDVGALAAVLRNLLDAPADASQLGANLRAHVMANFTWAATLERYMSLLDLAPSTHE